MTDKSGFSDQQIRKLLGRDRSDDDGILLLKTRCVSVVQRMHDVKNKHIESIYDDITGTHCLQAAVATIGVNRADDLTRLGSQVASAYEDFQKERVTTAFFSLCSGFEEPTRDLIDRKPTEDGIASAIKDHPAFSYYSMQEKEMIAKLLYIYNLQTKSKFTSNLIFTSINDLRNPDATMIDKVKEVAEARAYLLKRERESRYNLTPDETVMLEILNTVCDYVCSKDSFFQNITRPPLTSRDFQSPDQGAHFPPPDDLISTFPPPEDVELQDESLEEKYGPFDIVANHRGEIRDIGTLEGQVALLEDLRNIQKRILEIAKRLGLEVRNFLPRESVQIPIRGLPETEEQWALIHKSVKLLKDGEFRINTIPLVEPERPRRQPGSRYARARVHESSLRYLVSLLRAPERFVLANGAVKCVIPGKADLLAGIRTHDAPDTITVIRKPVSEKMIQRYHGLRNLAVEKNWDDTIRSELQTTGIKTVDANMPSQKVSIEGQLSLDSQSKFTFRREWGYWEVEGPVPLDVAYEMYFDPIGQEDIRAGGSAGQEDPKNYAYPTSEVIAQYLKTHSLEGIRLDEVRELCDNGKIDTPFFVSKYHIDSLVGLQLFVDIIRKHKLVDPL